MNTSYGHRSRKHLASSVAIALFASALVLTAPSFRATAAPIATHIVGWGYDNAGQLDIPSGLTDVVAITAGYDHSLALRAGGTVVGWGSNTFGQIAIPTGLTDVTAIAAGSYYSLALRSDGTVVGWGSNASGQAIPPSGSPMSPRSPPADNTLWPSAATAPSSAGAPTVSGEATPPTGLTDVTAIAAGSDYSLALRSDGTVVGWGSNEYWGQATPDRAHRRHRDRSRPLAQPCTPQRRHRRRLGFQ